MSNHDDFQLDTKKVNFDNDQEVRGPLSWLGGTVLTSIVTGCTGDCLTRHCADNVTKNTGCTVTHPRCKR